jgi:hypothetical protein
MSENSTLERRFLDGVLICEAKAGKSTFSK